MQRCAQDSAVPGKQEQKLDSSGYTGKNETGTCAGHRQLRWKVLLLTLRLAGCA